MSKPKTADELAAEAAERMYKGGRQGQDDKSKPVQGASSEPPLEKGGAGAMPTNMKGALGGLASKAPGEPLDKGDGTMDMAKMKKRDGYDDMDDDGKKKYDEKLQKMEGDYTKSRNEENEENDEEESDDESEKGEVADADDLMKAMDALDAAADGLDEPEIDRRAELAKGLEEGTLTDEERGELIGLLGGEVPTPAEDAIDKGGDGKDDGDPKGDGDPLNKGFEDVFTEEFNNDYDVSPFLEKFGHAVGAGLDIMREDLVKSASDQTRFNRALAKSFRGVGTILQSQQDMIKSLSVQNTTLAERLGIVEQQPTARKSVSNPGQARAIQKSFADGSGESEMSRENIFKGLHLLNAKYKDTGGRAKNGEPIDRAMSSFEISGNISKSLLAEVKDALGEGQQ